MAVIVAIAILLPLRSNWQVDMHTSRQQSGVCRLREAAASSGDGYGVPQAGEHRPTGVRVFYFEDGLSRRVDGGRDQVDGQAD